MRSVRFNDKELETISIIYSIVEEDENTSTIFDPYQDDELPSSLHTLEKIHFCDDVEFKRSGSHSLLYDKLSADFESVSIRPIRRKRDNDLDISHHVSPHRSLASSMGSSCFKQNDNLDTTHHHRGSERRELCF
jgi:hypothetical protein